MSSIAMLGVALLLVLANGFFVAVEFALISARRGRVEEMAEEGRFGSRAALRGMSSINVQLAASQLGISIVSLLLGWMVEPVVGSWLTGLLGRTELPTGVSRGISLFLGLSIVAFVHMVLGEMVPKSVALANPEKTVLVLSPVYGMFVLVVSPIVKVLHWLARAGTRLVGVEPTDELSHAHTTTELAVMVEEARASGELAPSEHELLTGAISFMKRTVDEVMSPAEALVTIPHTATVGEAEALMAESGHSRVLVMGDSPDQVIGFLHAKDLIHLPDERHSGLLPPGIVRLALRVGGAELLEEVLPKMRRARQHVAVVLDADHVVGLITLEDILEAIVGDISDESDILESIKNLERNGEP